MSKLFELSNVSYEAEIILNRMGYGGDNIDYLSDEIESNYFIDKNLKLAIKYEPSYFDWEQIWINIWINKDQMLLAIASGVLSKLGGDIYTLLKKVVSTKTKVEDAKPVVQLNFHIDELNLYIDGIEESNVEKLTDETLGELLKTTLESGMSRNEHIDDIPDEQKLSDLHTDDVK
jgi:hypothetical protein